MRTLALLLLAATSNNHYTPTFPGGIIAWFVCNSRKRQEYGGWLLFFYWQLYSGAIVTLIFFCMNFQSYVPENFGADQGRYLWFLASVLPTFVIFALQLGVATVLISVRTWDLLRLLRGLVVAQVVASLVSVVIQAKMFPDNLALELMFTLLPFSCWSAYFFASKRVRHVFRAHDWDTYIETLYPTGATTKLGI